MDESNLKINVLSSLFQLRHLIKLSCLLVNNASTMNESLNYLLKILLREIGDEAVLYFVDLEQELCLGWYSSRPGLEASADDAFCTRRQSSRMESVLRNYKRRLDESVLECVWLAQSGSLSQHALSDIEAFKQRVQAEIERLELYVTREAEEISD